MLSYSIDGGDSTSLSDTSGTTVECGLGMMPSSYSAALFFAGDGYALVYDFGIERLGMMILIK